MARDRLARRARACRSMPGSQAAASTIVCVLHADTLPPDDMIAVIERVMADPGTALAGFIPLIAGERTRWGTSFHNSIKTWYAPLLVRPHLFLRGVRLLFGDHAMFFRRDDFLARRRLRSRPAGDGGGGPVHQAGAARAGAAGQPRRPHVGPADRRVGAAQGELDLLQGRDAVGARRARPAGAALSARPLAAGRKPAAMQ